MSEIYDIIIIGAGPVGLYTAFFAQMRAAKVKIIESLDEIGGQPNHLYPEKIIYDIPAHPQVTGSNLIHQLHQQLQHFDTEICLGEEVINLAFTDQTYYHLLTNKGHHLGKAVIIATGNGAFQPRKLELQEASLYEGKSLHYLVKNLEDFRDKRIAICGGGDSAVDWALSLEPIVDKLYLIHRRDNFRALEHNVQRLRKSQVEVLTPFKVDQIKGDLGHIQSLVLKKVRSDEEKEIKIDQLIVNFGFSSSLGQIKNWGLDVVRNQIPVSPSMETNLPGVYAVGDIADYDGKVRIIAAGFGEGLIAVNKALHFIDPNYQPSPLHSTSLFEGVNS